MQRILRFAQCLSLFGLAILSAEAAWTIHFLRPKVAVTVSNTDRAMIAVGAAAGNLEKASREWQQASKDQASETTKAMSNVSAAADRFSTFISNTDRSVNSDLIPHLATAVKDQNDALISTQKELQASIARMGLATAEAQKVLADADAQISNPAVKESVDSLAVTAHNTADLTEHAAATMKSVRSGVEYEVAEIEKPVKKAKAALLFVIKAIGLFFGY